MRVLCDILGLSLSLSLSLSRARAMWFVRYVICVCACIPTRRVQYIIIYCTRCAAPHTHGTHQGPAFQGQCPYPGLTEENGFTHRCCAEEGPLTQVLLQRRRSPSRRKGPHTHVLCRPNSVLRRRDSSFKDPTPDLEKGSPACSAQKRSTGGSGGTVAALWHTHTHSLSPRRAGVQARAAAAAL